MAQPFDFDRIEDWGPDLLAEVQHLELVPNDVRERMAAANPKLIEDARDCLFNLGLRELIGDRVSKWVEQRDVFAYHGTRITPDEQASILREGLMPLIPASRATRLRRALSPHPKWNEAEGRLHEAIEDFCSSKYGNRIGQVHLTVSRAGLIHAFHYYWSQGSEFDWHVSNVLLGEEGKRLIAQDGEPRIVRVSIPGQSAFAACNRYGWSRGEFPNLVREIIDQWSYWLAHPDYRSEQSQIDCGLTFYETVPPDWIREIVAP
jgi:hypothetical protein